jgi:hypothetical protein
MEKFAGVRDEAGTKDNCKRTPAPQVTIYMEGAPQPLGSSLLLRLFDLLLVFQFLFRGIAICFFEIRKYTAEVRITPMRTYLPIFASFSYRTFHFLNPLFPIIGASI